MPEAELSGRLAGYMREHSITVWSVSSFSGGSALPERGGSFDMIQMEQPDGMEEAKLLRRPVKRGENIS